MRTLAVIDRMLSRRSRRGDGFFGGWFGQVSERDREGWAAVERAEMLRAEALLLGRRSDERFAEPRPTRPC